MTGRPPILLGLLLLSGCGRLLDVSVTILVPPDVQALYSETNPGWLILSIDHPDLGRTISPAVICNPSEETRDYTYDAGAMGCPSPVTITAWIEPWDRPGDPVCRANDDWLERDPNPRSIWPQARDKVWADVSEDNCEPVESEGVLLELVLPELTTSSPTLSE